MPGNRPCRRDDPSGRNSPPAAAGILCILLVGRSGTPPTVLVDTPTGVTPIFTPSPAMPAGLVGPPPGLDNPPAGIVQPGDRNGIYAGTAVPLKTGGGLCIENQPVSGFRVRSNSVSYGEFRGRIAIDGGLQMVYAQDWIIGQFEGATFHGQLEPQRSLRRSRLYLHAQP